MTAHSLKVSAPLSPSIPRFPEDINCILHVGCRRGARGATYTRQQTTLPTMANEITCDQCSALLTTEGLKQAQTAEGFALRPVSEYDANEKFDKRDWDGVNGNKCWMCIRIQHWLWPRLEFNASVPTEIAEIEFGRVGGFPGPWRKPEAWVRVWTNSVEDSPERGTWTSGEGARPCSLQAYGLKAFNFLTVKDPRINHIVPRRVFSMKPETGFLCWTTDGKFSVANRAALLSIKHLNRYG
jgi:hypothetical protein